MASLVHKIKSQVLETYTLWRYIFYRAYLRLQVIHEKSVIGFLWEPLMIIIVTIILSTVWAQVLDEQDFRSYFIYLLVGFSCWYYISAVVNTGTSVFYQRRKSISDNNFPLLSYPIEEIVRNSFSFLLMLPLILIAVAYVYGISLTSLFFLLTGIVLITLSGIGFALTIGIIAFFFGDFGQMIKAIMRVAFMATPILWHPERLGEYEHLLVLNPFYGYIHFCREGFIHGIVEADVALIIIVQTLIILVLGFISLAIFSSGIRKKAFEL